MYESDSYIDTRTKMSRERNDAKTESRNKRRYEPPIIASLGRVNEMTLGNGLATIDDGGAST